MLCWMVPDNLSESVMVIKYSVLIQVGSLENFSSVWLDFSYSKLGGAHHKPQYYGTTVKHFWSVKPNIVQFYPKSILLST